MKSDIQGVFTKIMQRAFFNLLLKIHINVSKIHLKFQKNDQKLSSLAVFAKFNKLTWRKKFRIWETKHLSADADSRTDAIGGWAKNTQKPDFFLNREKHQKRKNSETSKNMTKLAIRPSTRGL